MQLADSWQVKKNNFMHTIILAGGFSTRLYPLTEYFPKALLTIKSKAILGYTLDKLSDQPELTSKITLVSNSRYLGHFKDFIKKNYSPKKINLIDDGCQNPDDRLGAIGDIEFTVDKLGIKDDLLVLASDTLSSIDMAGFYKFFLRKKSVINAVFDTHDAKVIASKLGCAVLRGDRIIDFMEKPATPKTSITSIPFYIFPKESIKYIKEYNAIGQNLDAPGSIIPWLLEKTGVYGYQVCGYYYDVGTIESYNFISSKVL